MVKRGRSTEGPNPRITKDELRELLEEVRTLNEKLVIASVHQQELAEDAERSTSQLNALLYSLIEGVIVVDAHGQLTVANPPARAILRLPSDGTLTRRHDLSKLTFCYPDGRLVPSDARPLNRALAGERFADYEVVLVLPSGIRCRIAFAGSAVRDVSGRVVLAILILRDVTEVRELEQLKEDYVSLVSHDLRGPLTISGRRALRHSRLHLLVTRYIRGRYHVQCFRST